MEIRMDKALKRTLSLDGIKTGEQAVFLSICAEKGITSRLTSLGFTPGVALEMTQNYGYGPLVVTIRGARVALGRQEARSITVQKDSIS
jgi:ferrous iron transport protein A